MKIELVEHGGGARLSTQVVNLIVHHCKAIYPSSSGTQVMYLVVHQRETTTGSTRSVHDLGARVVHLSVHRPNRRIVLPLKVHYLGT